MALKCQQSSSDSISLRKNWNLEQRKAGGCQQMLTKSWTDEHIIIQSVFMLCSAAHVILDNQLTVTCLALVGGFKIMNEVNV